MEKRADILIFAGTTEGRELAEYASGLGVSCFVSTATEYGKSMIEGLDGIAGVCGRMDQREMEAFIRRHGIRLVIDATHPFAEAVTANISQACRSVGREYVRCLREQWQMQEERPAGIVVLESVEGAVKWLEGTEGNILIATGSKELCKYTRITGYRERCFARVLSTKAAVEESVKLGFEGRHLIAMQGPFSAEMNTALLHQTEARYFVTKESGRNGGFAEKAEAAERAGAVLVVIGRPKEEGESLEAVKKLIDKKAEEKQREDAALKEREETLWLRD
jgi:precorrin-6A/cobalt-precorrin-6A reductase